MKKSLFAIAAVTAFAGAAQAQSSVTVYGVMDLSYTAAENASTTTAGVKTTNKSRNTANGDGAYSTSRIGFRGVEDLGGGKQAQFVLEYDLINLGNGGNGTDTATAETGTSTNARTNSLGARYAWVGVSDKNLGGLRIGRQESSMHGAFTNGLAGQANNMQGSIYSGGSSNANVITAGVRPYEVFVNQAITYVAPQFAGIDAQVQYAQNAYSATDTTPSAGVSAFGGSLRYSGVKNLTVAYALQQENTVVLDAAAVAATAGSAGTAAVVGANTKVLRNVLTANYDFKIVQAFALASTSKTTNQSLTANQTTRNQTAYEIGLRAPVTPVIQVWASAFMGNKKMDANATTLNATTTGRADLSGFQLGTQYNLSKRTTAYAIYGTQQVKGKDLASGAKIDSTGYAVGLRHTF